MKIQYALCIETLAVYLRKVAWAYCLRFRLRFDNFLLRLHVATLRSNRRYNLCLMLNYKLIITYGF